MRNLTPSQDSIFSVPEVQKEKAFRGKKDKLWPGYIDLNQFYHLLEKNELDCQVGNLQTLVKIKESALKIPKNQSLLFASALALVEEIPL